ncbi:hypothetical protein FOZ60_012771 [Perkinsus olseni]|uniref:RNase H type-1 domain-containing protein n=1 Tax=Perkinsus olseni TaxID=32597 RepID=A0A7J6NB00_PEROL|nr:hypothetical protein FOZ60_012771 [Perkinsus olseni]
MAARRLALLVDELALGRLLKVKGLQHEQPSVAIQQWRALPIQPWETRLGTVIAEREQALHYAKQAMRSRNAIHTDGSGVQVHSASWRLPSYSSITECELHAVEQAARWVIAVLRILASRARTQKWEKARQIAILLRGLTELVRLHWVPGHSEVEGNEVNAEGCVSGRTLTRYLKEQMRIATRFWWSDERAKLRTAIKEFFSCVSHASLWIRREVTPAASASCPFLAPARKRVAGGIPFHLYRIVTDLKRRKAFNRLMKAIMKHLDVTAAAQQDPVIKKMPLFSGGGNSEEGRQQLRKTVAAGDGRASEDHYCVRLA